MTYFGHEFLPHAEQAVYGACALSAIIFGVLSVLVSLVTEGKFQLPHTIAQTGAGTIVPIFVMLPFTPYDKDLMEVLMHEPIALFLAGLFGIGISLYTLFYTNERTRNPYAPRTKRPVANGRPRGRKAKAEQQLIEGPETPLEIGGAWIDPAKILVQPETKEQGGKTPDAEPGEPG